MRKLVFIALFFCVRICLPAAAFSQVSGNQTKPLSALEQALVANTKAIPEAQKNKNVGFLKHALTDDFLAVGSEGHFTIRTKS
jgi:hypothetical protein